MSKAWLSDLEEKVQEAATRLRAMRAEKEDLQTQVGDLENRVAELELELEEAQAKAAESQGEGSVELEAAAAEWREERQEIRGRVEKLVDHLSDLLET